MKQESNRQRTMEDTDGGLHPTVDGQSPGERCEMGTGGGGDELTLVSMGPGEMQLNLMPYLAHSTARDLQMEHDTVYCNSPM